MGTIQYNTIPGPTKVQMSTTIKPQSTFEYNYDKRQIKLKLMFATSPLLRKKCLLKQSPNFEMSTKHENSWFLTGVNTLLCYYFCCEYKNIQRKMTTNACQNDVLKSLIKLFYKGSLQFTLQVNNLAF